MPKQNNYDISANVAAEKLRIAMVKNDNMTLSKLASLLECSPSNISNKFKRSNFHESEIREIANLLNYDVEITLISRETGETI